MLELAKKRSKAPNGSYHAIHLQAKRTLHENSFAN